MREQEGSKREMDSEGGKGGVREIGELVKDRGKRESEGWGGWEG